MWPTTGIPASTMARICSQTPAPPSSLTAWHLPSFIRRAALATAVGTSVWYEPNGMSPTTKVSLVARVTQRVWWTMSSMVTGRVESYPIMVMPSESPTRIVSIPACSVSAAIV